MRPWYFREAARQEARQHVRQRSCTRTWPSRRGRRTTTVSALLHWCPTEQTHVTTTLYLLGKAQVPCSRGTHQRACRQRSASTSQRQPLIEQALLRHLYDTGGSRDIASFFDTPASVVPGRLNQRWGPSEVDAALTVLAKFQLIDGVNVEEFTAPLNPSLTADGMECVEVYGGKRSDWLRSR